MRDGKKPIHKRLQPPVTEVQRRLVHLLSETTIEELEEIAKTSSAKSGASISEKTVIEDAIAAYMEDAIPRPDGFDSETFRQGIKDRALCKECVL